MLHSIARGYRLCEADADDVVQITWGRALLHLDRLDDPGAVAGWLAVTARREAMRTLQRGVRELPAAEPPEPDMRRARPRRRRRSSASAAPSCAPRSAA